MAGLQLEQELVIVRLPGPLGPGLGEEEAGGGQHGPGGQQRRRPAPGDVVVVRVEEPGAGPAADSEHEADHGEEDADHEVEEADDQEEAGAELEPGGLGRVKDGGEREEPGDDGEDEADEEEALDGEQPGRHEPLPDLVIGGAPHGVTPVEQDIKLEPGISEPVEANLPGPHADKGRLGVLPGDKPGRGG